MKEISGTIFKTRKCLLGCWLFAVRDAMEKHLIYPKCYFIMPYACFLFYIYISAFNSFFLKHITELKLHVGKCFIHTFHIARVSHV